MFNRKSSMPELVNAPAAPAAVAYRPARPSRYIVAALGSGVARFVPATRHAQWPSAAQLRDIGLEQLAAAVDQHGAALAALYAAATEFDQSEAPTGAAWHAAVDQARTDDGAPVRDLLAARPARIARAVVCAHRVNDCFDQVLEQAAAADPAIAEHALDGWVAQAAQDVHGGAQRGDRMRLARVEQEQASVYPRLRATWAWLASDGVDPYRPTPAGVDRRLADAIIENAEAAGRLMGGRTGLYSQIVINQLMPSGVAQ